MALHQSNSHKLLVLSLSVFWIGNASAALFDTIESVETLQKVAAKKQESDRLPAGQVTPASEDSDQTQKSESVDKK